MNYQERKEIKIKIALAKTPKEARRLYTLIIKDEKERSRQRYQERKNQARAEAIEWQQDQNPKSWGQCAEMCAHFYELAKKYGLVKEFKENGII